MYANGFLEQKKRSPVSLAAVIGLHATALGAVILFGTTTFVPQKAGNTIIFDVPIDEPPPPEPPPQPRPQTPQQVSTPTVTPQVLPPILPTIAAQVTPPRTHQEPTTPPGPQIATASIPRIPEPVRHAAEVDPRFRAALQPPYPPNMERLQREGRVQVRVTIGTDGRVTAIEQLSSADEAFWRVTQRQALNNWRFRPATVDGRPVVSRMLFTVTFRLPEV